MQLQQRINAWLTNPSNYSEGLSLLEESGKRGILLRTLALGDDAYNRERLETELRTWLGQQNVLPIGGVLAPGRTMVSEQSTAPTTGHARPVAQHTTAGIDALKDEAQDLMNERSELKAMLRALMLGVLMNDEIAQAKRKGWAFRILAITDKLDDIYSRLDFVDEYGYLPPTENTAEPLDPTAELMNVRSYVSRYKAKLNKKNLTPEQRRSWMVLLEQYTARKNQLELKLLSNHDPDSTRQQTAHRQDDPPTLPRT
jgi:hypothetical protein